MLEYPYFSLMFVAQGTCWEAYAELLRRLERVLASSNRLTVMIVATTQLEGEVSGQSIETGHFPSCVPPYASQP